MPAFGFPLGWKKRQEASQLWVQSSFCASHRVQFESLDPSQLVARCFSFPTSLSHHYPPSCPPIPLLHIYGFHSCSDSCMPCFTTTLLPFSFPCRMFLCCLPLLFSLSHYSILCLSTFLHLLTIWNRALESPCIGRTVEAEREGELLCCTVPYFTLRIFLYNTATLHCTSVQDYTKLHSSLLDNASKLHFGTESS